MNFVKVVHKQAKTIKSEIDPYLSKSTKIIKDLDYVYFPVANIPIDLLSKYEIAERTDFEPTSTKSDIFNFYYEVYSPSIYILHEQPIQVYRELCGKFSCRFIILKEKIHHDTIRAPQTRLLYPLSEANTDDVYASTVQNSVNYRWYPLHTMFCRGNIEEKIRISKLCLAQQEVLLDLYAGIGYWVIPLMKLQANKVKHVFACDMNPWSIKALGENIALNKIDNNIVTICEGDNRQFINAYEGLCDRVFLGLLPSSQSGWDLAIRALKENTGGYLHIHENLPKPEIESFSSYIILKLKELSDIHKKGFNMSIIEKITCVKSYSPKVYHYVFDVKVYKG
jgi:tRNA wybutosine-synthesizing protein 2